jgi:heme O synthase-like polyprenyltransferase
MAFAGGTAMTIIIAAAIDRHFPAALFYYPVRLCAGVLIVAIAWRLFGRKPAPLKQLGGLDPNSRKWARAMYHNGLISLEELNSFYLTHPEEENDTSGGPNN